MKNKKEVKQTEEEIVAKAAEVDKTIAGNCSKCNGPVVSKWYVGGVRVGEYHECLNCGAKHFPSFGKTIEMDNDKKHDKIWWEKNTEKLKDDLIKGDEYWPNNTPYTPVNPYPYLYPTYPTNPYHYPYTYPIITCYNGYASSSDHSGLKCCATW